MDFSIQMMSLLLVCGLTSSLQATPPEVQKQVIQVEEPLKPEVRKPIVRSVIQPSISTTDTIVVAQVQVRPQSATGTKSHPTTAQTGEDWGAIDGQAVSLYSLKNKNGMTAKITNYGALLTALQVPDRNGKLADVVLGFDNLQGYLDGHPYFGCTVGRIANRIAKGKFILESQEYTLATNNAPNHLHGGDVGFDKKVWTVEEADAHSVKMTYTSPDGEEGYPGRLTATVVYSLSDNNALRVEMSATTDATTIVNLVNHSYWNLEGHNSGNILGHELMLNATTYTPVDSTFIPTGSIDTVKHTPFDFTQAKAIGAEINQLIGNGPSDPGGYDINFVLDGKYGEMKLAAKVKDFKSGRVMEIHTTDPGVQFYTGNFLDGTVKGKGGAVYRKNAAFCLETQKYPDSINNEGKQGWYSVILHPDETYSHTDLYKFTTE